MFLKCIFYIKKGEQIEITKFKADVKKNISQSITFYIPHTTNNSLYSTFYIQLCRGEMGFIRSNKYPVKKKIHTLNQLYQLGCVWTQWISFINRELSILILIPEEGFFDTKKNYPILLSNYLITSNFSLFHEIPLAGKCKNVSDPQHFSKIISFCIFYRLQKG